MSTYFLDTSSLVKRYHQEHISAVICADERFGQIIELEGFKVANPTNDRSQRDQGGAR